MSATGNKNLSTTLAQAVEGTAGGSCNHIKATEADSNAKLKYNYNQK